MQPEDLQVFRQCWVRGEISVAHKTRKRVKQYGQQLHGRSRLTNGTAILPTIDHRSSWARRYRDIYDGLLADLGVAEEQIGEMQRGLCKHAAAMLVELENMTVKFAQNGGADAGDLNVFQRTYNTVRRGGESLNTHRGRLMRDVTGLTLGDVLRAGIDHKIDDVEAAE
jgi:hypothetical protein